MGLGCASRKLSVPPFVARPRLVLQFVVVLDGAVDEWLRRGPPRRMSIELEVSVRHSRDGEEEVATHEAVAIGEPLRMARAPGQEQQARGFDGLARQDEDPRLHGVMPSIGGSPLSTTYAPRPVALQPVGRGARTYAATPGGERLWQEGLEGASLRARGASIASAVARVLTRTARFTVEGQDGPRQREGMHPHAGEDPVDVARHGVLLHRRLRKLGAGATIREMLREIDHSSREPHDPLDAVVVGLEVVV